MNVQVRAHGLLTAAVRNPEGLIRLEVPDGIDILGVVEILCEERSPLFDPRSCIAVMDGAKVPLDHILVDGDRVDLYVLFGGG